LRNRRKDKALDDGASQPGDGQEVQPTDPPLHSGPGSKQRRGEQPKDTVRAMVLERIRERGLTIADLSRALAKNDAYIHQFIWRGSPNWLGESDRAIVCRMLDIPDAVLKPPMAEPGRPNRGVLSSASLGRAELRDVPLFREDDEINAASANEWADRLPGWGAGVAIALWITSERGRFSPGDLIYIHQRQPPRVGDYVVAVSERRVIVIGRLVSVDQRGQRVIQGEACQNTSIPTGVTTYKVVAAFYA
jgi:hypothetical protein